MGGDKPDLAALQSSSSLKNDRIEAYLGFGGSIRNSDLIQRINPKLFKYVRKNLLSGA